MSLTRWTSKTKWPSMKQWSSKLFRLLRPVSMPPSMHAPRSWQLLIPSGAAMTAQNRSGTMWTFRHPLCQDSISFSSFSMRKTRQRIIKSLGILLTCTDCRTRPWTQTSQWNSSRPISRCAAPSSPSSLVTPRRSSRTSTKGCARQMLIERTRKLRIATPCGSWSHWLGWVRLWHACMPTRWSDCLTSVRCADCYVPAISTSWSQTWSSLTTSSKWTKKSNKSARPKTPTMISS